VVVSGYITPKAVKGRPSGIEGRDWQLPELQRKYGGYFSWYLLRRFASLAGRSVRPSRTAGSAPRAAGWRCAPG
jgi:hypothetical protein